MNTERLQWEPLWKPGEEAEYERRRRERFDRLLDVHVQLLAHIDRIGEENHCRRGWRRILRRMEASRRMKPSTAEQDAIRADIAARIAARKRAGLWPAKLGEFQPPSIR